MSWLWLCNSMQEPYIPDNEADLGEPGDDIVAREAMQDIRYYAYPASLSAGSGHSLMIAYSGWVYSYGFSHYGVLGLNSFAISEASPKRMVNRYRVRTASVSAGATHSLALTEVSQRTIFCTKFLRVLLAALSMSFTLSDPEKCIFAKPYRLAPSFHLHSFDTSPPCRAKSHFL